MRQRSERTGALPRRVRSFVYLPTFPAFVTRISIVAFGRYVRLSPRTLISLAATALRLNAQPFPLQRILTCVPRGVLTVTRVSVVRVPLKRPAMRIAGNGLMNESVVIGAGSAPAPVCVPEVNVPCPGPVGVTSTHVFCFVLGATYGLMAARLESFEAACPVDSLTV